MEPIVGSLCYIIQVQNGHRLIGACADSENDTCLLIYIVKWCVVVHYLKSTDDIWMANQCSVLAAIGFVL